MPLGERLWRDQPARLVGAQRLRVHVRELGGDRDHEHAAVGFNLDARDGFGQGLARAHDDASSNRGARGSPFIVFASASTAERCSLVSVSGTSIVNR